MDGNAHVTWHQRFDTRAEEIIYAMVNGQTGEFDNRLLVPPTVISADDGYKSKRSSVSVNAGGDVFIVWNDGRYEVDEGEGAEEIFFTKIHPDAEEGTVATIIDDTALTENDSKKSNLPTHVIDSEGNLHITWMEFWNSENSGYLYYMKVDGDGNKLVSDTKATGYTADSASSWTLAFLDTDADNKPHVVWADERHRDEEHNLEIYYWQPGNGIGDACDVSDDRDNDGVPDDEDMVEGEPAGYTVTQQGSTVTVTNAGSGAIIFTAVMTAPATDLQITQSVGTLLKIEGMPNSNKTVYFASAPSVVCVQDTPTLTLSADDSCAGDNKFLLTCPGQATDPSDGSTVTCNMSGTTAIISPLNYSGISSYVPTGGGGYRTASEARENLKRKAGAEKTAKEEAVPVVTKSPFTDIIGHFAEAYINKLYQKGAITGKTATRYAPNTAMTRSELVKTVVEAFNVPVTSVTATSFSDVDPKAWYASYVEAAYKAGLVEGYAAKVNGVTQKVFYHNRPVSRAEALKIILTAAKVTLPNATVKFPDTTLYAWYAKYLSYAKVKNIVSGYADGKFRPANSVTRGEAAKIIIKALEMK